MDASKTGAGNSSQQQSSKRNFFQWAIKWFYATIPEDTQEKPDVPFLTTLFQSIGFHLREFKKSDNVNNDDGSRAGNDTIKVVIECGNSGMKACLELENVKCQCPDSKDAEDASFWSVSGIGPTNASAMESANKIQASGSNLLPPVSRDTAKVINDVVYHLFKIIGNKTVPDVNQNTRSRSNLNLSHVGNNGDSESRVVDETFRRESQNFGRSYTQPEIVLNTNDRSTYQKTLFKEPTSSWGETFDIEDIDTDHPRPSPPKTVISPVFSSSELCCSLDSISLQSEQNTANLTTHVIQAHKSLEKALKIIRTSRSPTHDQTFLKSTAKHSTNLTVGDSTRKRSSNINSSCKQISPNNTHSLPVSSYSMSSRGHATLSLPKSNPTTGALKVPMTRRSVGSTSTRIAAHPDGVGGKSSQSNASTASKIPGQRKSFHSSGSAKLSAFSAKNNDTFADKDVLSNSLNASGACQSAIPKMSTSLNQSSTIPTLKVMPMKTSGEKEKKQQTARRSVGNPRFGYGSKKT